MEIWKGKKYELTFTEKFNEYMLELGVGWIMRAAGNATSPTVSLARDGDTYTLSTESTFKTSIISFKLGEPFAEETLDGRNVTSVITLDGNKLTHKQGGEKPSTIIREFSDKEMVATMTVGDVVCIRKYTAV